MSDRAYQRRDAALAILEEFRDRLVCDRDETCVSARVGDTLARLQAVQGSWSDRPHFAKSLTQMATALRHRAWPAEARRLLEWALDHGVVDTYLLNDLVQCHLILGDMQAAERTFALAEHWSLLSEGLYTTLINAYGKTGSLQKARRLFDEAHARGLLGRYGHTALIDAYGQAGDIDRACETFEAARRQGLLHAASYTALIDALGRLGDVSSAERHFEEARSRRLVDHRMTTALLTAYARVDAWEPARRVFREAWATGLVDGPMLRVLARAPWPVPAHPLAPWVEDRKASS